MNVQENVLLMHVQFILRLRNVWTVWDEGPAAEQVQLGNSK